MKKTVLAIVVALLLQAPAALGNNWTGKNPFIEAMRSMLDLFSMLQSYQQLSSLSSMSSMSAFPGQGMYSQPGSNYMPPNSPWTSNIPPFGSPGTDSLDGIWVSRSQQLLIVKKNFARLYRSRDDYRDYFLKIGPGRLLFKEADSGIVRQFEMARKQDQLALRDRQGQLTLFRKYRQEYQ